MDRGAVAVFVAILCVTLFVAAAFAVDLGNLVVKKQALGNTLDAASLAGATSLPSMAAARAAVGRSLADNDPAQYGACALTPSAASCPQPIFYCIMSATTAGTPDLSFVHTPLGTSTLAGTCDPGAGLLQGPEGGVGPYSWSCTAGTCRIEMNTSSANNLQGCDQLTPATCANAQAMSLGAAQTVPYVFGPVIGKSNGNTGTIRSVACGHLCAGYSSTPVDIVIIADRSSSMFNADKSTTIPKGTFATSEGAAIRTALTDLNDASIVHVAMGTVGITDETSTICSPAADIKPAGQGSPPVVGNVVPNSWIPVGFDKSYVAGGVFNSSSPVGAAAACLASATTSNVVAKSQTGTWLGSPLKVAADTLLGGVTLNSPSEVLQSGSNKAIIFETDEQPNESGSTDCSGTPSSCTVGAAGDHKTIGNSKGTTACKNFQTVATNAKAQGITIAVVTYNPGTGQDCKALLRLANDPAASMDSAGNYLVYTPTSAAQLAAAFKAAISAVRGTPHLISLP